MSNSVNVGQRTGRELEVLTFGRAGVDIYPMQVGVGLEDVDTFGKYLGGTNAAGAIFASRLECSTAMPTEDEINTLIAGGDPNAGLADDQAVYFDAVGK